MKKILVWSVVLMTFVFLYFYQLPIMDTGQAILKAEEILKDPPEAWKKSLTDPPELREIPSENIIATLKPKRGFWNELTNRRQWEVTIKYNGQAPTVVLDAYTGEYMNLFGPVN